MLSSLQGNYLRAAAGAMRSTPTAALEVALMVPPLDLQIKCLARITAYRLKCQGEWRESGIGHANIKLLHARPFAAKQDRIPSQNLEERSFKALVPTREDWEIKKLMNSPRTMHWYTDGSGYRGGYGAGVYGPQSDHRESIPMGKHATVFQAEVLAIQRCSEHLLSKEVTCCRIRIFSDSRAAIEALMKLYTVSSIVWDFMQSR